MADKQPTIPNLEAIIKHLLLSEGKDTLALLITKNPQKILQSVHNVLKKIEHPPEWINSLFNIVKKYCESNQLPIPPPFIVYASQVYFNGVEMDNDPIHIS